MSERPSELLRWLGDETLEERAAANSYPSCVIAQYALALEADRDRLLRIEQAARALTARPFGQLTPRKFYALREALNEQGEGG